MTCQHCAEKDERIAWLESELGTRTDFERIDAIRRALKRSGRNRGGNTARLIEALYAAKGRMLTRWQLMVAMPPEDHGEDERNPNMVSVYVAWARKGIGHDGIESVWGSGYRITEAGMARVAEILGEGQAMPVSV